MKVSGVNSEASKPTGAFVDLVGRLGRDAVAQDALALLRAFIDRDLDEIMFRATLLGHHAQELECPELGDASETLLREMTAGSHANDDGGVARALERVIAAAAKVVSTGSGSG